MNVNALFAAHDLNRNYASKEIRARTGYTALDYIHFVRVRHAKEYLTDPSVTVEEAAQACGFTNSAALNRAFRKFEGHTAGEWRNRI